MTNKDLFFDLITSGENTPLKVVVGLRKLYVSGAIRKNARLLSEAQEASLNLEEIQTTLRGLECFASLVNYGMSKQGLHLYFTAIFNLDKNDIFHLINYLVKGKYLIETIIESGPTYSINHDMFQDA